MASRYLRASGNWNGPVWASTSNGVAGSASTPSLSDSVYITGNYTVTLNSDVDITYMTLNGSTPGSLRSVKLNGYTMTLETFYLAVGTLDMTNSTMKFVRRDGSSDGGFGGFNNTNTIVHASGSTIEMDIWSSNSQTFMARNSVFGDVSINLGTTSGGKTLNIIGSPTFRSLTIQSKNTAAHTVNLEGKIKTEKFIGIGSSSANKLTLDGSGYVPGGVAPIEVLNYGTSYGQYLNIQSVYVYGVGSPTTYAGSNSTADSLSTGWLLQNPPIASSLQDQFVTLSSSKWVRQVYGSAAFITAMSGGKLRMGWTAGTAYVRLDSKDSYNLTNDAFYVQVTSSTGGLFLNAVPVAIQGEQASVQGVQISSSSERFWRIIGTATGDNGTLSIQWYDDGEWVNEYSKSLPSSQLASVKLSINGTRDLSPAELVIESVGVPPFPTQPIADFSASPTTGLRPVTINFTDLTKGIPDTWSWSFGDGYTSTQKNPSHPYSKAGTYTVSLTASNSVGTSTVTKTNLIVVDPLVVSRETSGTLLFGGGSTRKLLAARTAGGGLVFGGETRAVLIRDAEALQDKMYLYKVYDPDGNFVEVWKDVMDEPNFTHEINTIGSTMTVQLARNSDTLGVTTSPLQTEAGTNILTESDQTILVSTETRNQVGPSSSVDYNNRVDVIVFYGMVEPLYTEDMQIILTEDDETILAESGAPNGRRIFSGFISEINSRYGNTETTVVQLTSYGYDLDQYALTTAYDNMVTTVTFNSTDPSDIARTAMARFVQASTDQLTYTHATTGSIATTGTVVSYTFRNNTYKEVLDKVLELMPSNWYYYVDLGTNTVHFQQRSVTPKHLFYLGKHITALDLKGSILGAVNHTLFTGGGEPALYVERKEAPALRVRRGLDILSDSRVTIPESAQIISDGKIEEGNKLQYRTTVEIVSKQYDIERIKVGDTVGFRNFNSFVDGLVMQVVGSSYSADIMQLQLDSKPPTINKRLEDVVRNLKVTENSQIPSTPS